MKRVLITCTCLLSMAPALHASEAMQLLNRMSSAVHELDYHGDLVYSLGDGYSILRIQHSVDDGSEHERVITLDSDEGHRVSYDTEEGFSIASFPQVSQDMQNVYSFDVGGIDKIAGRSCKEVVARPKDRMRYLHRYCIDTETNMLLNYSLVNSQHKTVERMMFTNIEFEKPNIKNYLKNKVSKIKSKFKPFNLTKRKEQKTNWIFSKLPKGFYVDSVLTRDESSGGHQHPLEQIILTDNVTSVSVFIEPENEHHINNKGLNYHGAVNGLTVEKEEHNITVIGEVPKATLTTIADGLQYNSR